MLEQKNNSIPLINVLKDLCFEINNSLEKFNSRSKRSLIDGLGTAIRSITGNLDQNDLTEINANLEALFKNQKGLIEQINKYTSFANHITDRHFKDINTIQQNINISLRALNEIKEKLDTQILIQYNIHLAEKLLLTIQNIQRTITLAFNGIANLEIITSQELLDITNHLKLLYTKEELLELDTVHLFKLIEFSKFKVISVNNTITCILYIPILNSNPYSYQKIYPIPNQNYEILLPPKRYRVLGIDGEYWTDEDCQTIEKQTICKNKFEVEMCSLQKMSTCTFILVINNYQLIHQLTNHKILISSKDPIKVTEACVGKINQETVINNTLISSEQRECKISVGNLNFYNTYNNYTYKVPKIHKIKFQTSKIIELKQEHLENPFKLKEEAIKLNHELELHPLVHIAHISTSAIVLLIILTLLIMICVFRARICNQIKKRNRKEASALPLEEIASPSQPQSVDALS